MAGWLFKGLRNGVRTTRYPSRREVAPGTQVGFPLATEFDRPEAAAQIVKRCPTGALRADGRRVEVDARLCIHCFRCVRGVREGMEWGAPPAPLLAQGGPETGGGAFHVPFVRSINILVVDAGDCGACLNEVRQLNAPQYNMHRLGFFVTPAPRHADLLLVVGQVSDAMREPLLSAYRAMPEPMRVAAVGGCALSGAPVGPSFTAGAGVAELLPVDIEVPGSPPTPLAILNALLVLSGRGVKTSEVQP